MRTGSRHTVAHILPFPSVGGTEHATLRIAEAVDPARFTHLAFCLPDAHAVRTLATDAGIPCVTYQPPVPSYLHGATFLRSSHNLARELVRRKVDLVHCANLLAAYHAGLAGRLAGIPILCHIRGRFEIISRRDGSFLWPVHKFVFVSEDTRRHFGYSVSADRGAVVYDGIDVPPDRDGSDDRESVRREFAIPAHAPIIGTMARVAPEKDFTTLARSAARIRQSEPDTRFLIVGDCDSVDTREHYEHVRRTLEACGVADAFIFTGYRTDVARLLSAFDVFVLSTHREGLPLVILEAMARAKPVVATAVDGIPEIVNHAEDGLLFPHEDHEALAAHIIALVKNREGARRLGEAGRCRVRNAFSRSQFAMAMNATYEGVVQDRRRWPLRS